MFESADHGGFALEALDDVGLKEGLWEQCFECDVAVDSDLFGSEDDAVGAPAEFFLDQVFPGDGVTGGGDGELFGHSRG